MAIRTNTKSISDAILGMDKVVVDDREIKLASGDVGAKIEKLVREIESSYKEGMDLTAEVARIAKRDNLQDKELDRLAQGINMRVYQLLFPKTAGKEDRTVRFKIADPFKAKEILGRTKKHTEESATTPGDGEEKVASPRTLAGMLEVYDPSTGTEDYYAAPIRGAFGEYLYEKIASNIYHHAEDIREKEASVKEDVEMLGIAFAKYASTRDLNHQNVFNKMCVDADFRKINQLRVKEAFDRFKGQFKVAEDVSLDLFDIDSCEDFSLGGHSISKVAEEPMKLPEISGKKRQIKDFEKLVNAALKIQEDDEMLEEMMQKMEAKKKIISEKEQELDKKREKRIEEGAI